MTDNVKLRYQLDVEPRHAYNILIIRDLNKIEGDHNNPNNSFNIVGTLRFENDEQGNKSLNLWKKWINRMEIMEAEEA